MEQKTCRVCKETKSVSFFGRLREGFAYECKACKKELGIKYREKNADAIREKKRAYYSENAERLKEKSRLNYEANRDHANKRQAAYNKAKGERHLEYKRQWREKNRQKLRDQAVEYRLKNRDAVNQAVREWFRKNPDKRKEYFHVRRARIKAAGGRFTSRQIEELREKQQGCCACCRGKLSDLGEHIDHIEPISTGGSNDILNIQLLCPDCNMRKKAKDPLDFMRENGFLL